MQKFHPKKSIYCSYLLHKNQLEFFDSVLLTQQLMPKEDLFVVGIADSYIGAVEMVQQITEEVYTNTGETDIRSYLLSKESDA